MSNGLSPVTFTYLTQTIEGFEGEPVAAALRRAGILELGRSGIDNSSRGVFCFMGSCQECRIRINGTVSYACKAPVFSNMTITPYAQS